MTSDLSESPEVGGRRASISRAPRRLRRRGAGPASPSARSAAAGQPRVGRREGVVDTAEGWHGDERSCDSMTVSAYANAVAGCQDAMALADAWAGWQAHEYAWADDVNDVVSVAQRVVLIGLDDDLRVLLEGRAGDLFGGHVLFSFLLEVRAPFRVYWLLSAQQFATHTFAAEKV